jgi:hypothetical protein
MLCEAKTKYISNMEIYTALGKKLNDMVMSVPENNLGVHHHVHQTIFTIVWIWLKTNWNTKSQYEAQ